MSTTQIELDQALLTQAAAILGTTTKKATVNEALRRVVQEDVRRRHIDELAASLKQYPNTRMLIVGHTDSDGSARYNRDLSNRRASSAANFIIGEGVESGRISRAGRGAAEPIATNDSDDGRRQNRRVEIAIYTSAGSGNRSGN